MIKKAQGGAKRVDHGMKAVQHVSDNRTNQLNSTLVRGFAISTVVSISSLLATISSRPLNRNEVCVPGNKGEAETA
jgi:hypothetical protein